MENSSGKLFVGQQIVEYGDGNYAEEFQKNY